MKIWVLILSILSFSVTCYSQKRDNIWVLGSGSYLNGLDFSNFLPDTFSIKGKMDFFFTDAGICDTTGNLLFYTNGIYISNKKNDSLVNCRNYNPGLMTSYYDLEGLGYRQGAIVIPMPDSVNKYYVFSESGQFVQGPVYNKPQALNLFYSVVDMSLDKGFGGIEDSLKAKSAVNDTLVAGFITACKNGNGRDWWVIVHKIYSDLYYKILVTPNGITGPYEQYIGTNITTDFLGRACFSPDGTKYAFMNELDTLDVFDFDRCTGLFSNPKIIPLADTNGFPGRAYYNSCAFSPDSRYLYANNNFNIWQIDLQNPNPVSSVTLVGTYDTTKITSGGDWFDDEQLAPDGKIYICSFNGSTIMHVIEDPDSSGTKSNFVQNGLQIAGYNVTSPNFPNYDLGEIIGGCDTASGIQETEPSDFGLHVYPNPVKQLLSIEYSTNQNMTCEIFDITGRMITRFTLYHYFKNRIYDVSKLPQGMYIVKVNDAGGVCTERKFVKE